MSIRMKVAVLCAVLLPLSARAGMLSLLPDSLETPAGELFELELVLSGFDSTDVSYFTVDLLYDQSVARFVGKTLGNGLGDILTGAAVDISFPDEPGLVNIAVQSFLADFSGQPSSFSLATLSFLGLGAGNLALDFGLAEFEDADFNLLDVALGDADVTVTSVPVPASLGLACLGLLLMAAAGPARRRVG